MNNKERLIELLIAWGTENCDSVPEDSIAEYLVQNGVVVEDN